MNGRTSITINGTAVDLYFGYPSVRMFIEAAEKKADLYYVGKQITVMGLAKIAQSGYVNKCELREVEPVLTYEDFVMWVEEMKDSEEGQAELSRVLTVYTDSTYVKKLIDVAGEPETDEKKTLTSTV